MSYVYRIRNASIKKRFLALILDGFFSIPFVLILYPLWKDRLFNGQSVGKRIVQIRVINFTTGEPCSLRKSLLRNFLNLVFFIGIFYIPFNDAKRHLADVIVGTMVIEEDLNKSL